MAADAPTEPDQEQSCHFESRRIGGGVIAPVRVCTNVGKAKIGPGETAVGPALRETLRGLSGVQLFVDSLAPELRALGLERHELKEEITERLTTKGVPVVDRASRLEGTPQLFVRLHPHPARDGLAFGVDLLLYQRVALSRLPDDRRMAVTWQVGQVGYSQPAHSLDVRLGIRAAVDRFANDFRAANQSP